MVTQSVTTEASFSKPNNLSIRLRQKISDFFTLICCSRTKLLNFELNKRHLREALLFCFHLKKTAAQAHDMLMDAYDTYAPSKTTCRDWFHRFKDGDFEVEDHERSGRPKLFEDDELEALIDQDPS